MKVRVIWEPRDLWVGVYWRRVKAKFGPWWQWRVYVCLIPCLPIVFEWYRRQP